MRQYCDDFSLTPGQIWLNAASEGPIPKVAAAALQSAVNWKFSPEQLTIAKFQQVPLELKKTIGRLIAVVADEVILGNSATYGLHLLANGLQFNAGDEILLMQNDFPSDILPWLHLKEKGVQVRQLKPRAEVLTAQEVQDAFTPNTKLVCLPHVHSFSGWALHIKNIGEFCRRRGTLFVVNMSQSIGAGEVRIADLPVDAVVCAGYKWLLGPYSTGFCWMRPQLRQKLNYPQAYWTALMDEKSLDATGELTLTDDHSSRRYDVFAPANFFNYVPWKASIEYLLEIGLPKVHQHIQELAAQILEGLDRKRFVVSSPIESGQRTSIVVFSYKDQAQNRRIYEFLKAHGIHTALWKNRLRLSPHIYNTSQDITTLLSVLDSFSI